MGAHLSSQYKKRPSSKVGLKGTKDLMSRNRPVSAVTTPPPSSTTSSEDVIRLGRKFHNEQSSVYWFPNDDEEMDRLVGQHFALKTLFEGNIPELARVDTIPFEDGAKILDLGCAGGTWIMDVATEFPNSEFIGIDMCDIFPSNIRPANVSFQTGNILEGLPFEDNTFNMVNMSFFILAFRKDDWAVVLKEIRRVLKPGGFLISREAGMLEIGTDFVKWAGRIFKEKMIERGQEPYIADEMKGLMEATDMQVVECIKKDSYPGRNDHLNQEFLWDLRSIFKSAQAFLAEQLEVPEEKYSAFLDELVAEIRKKPETKWSMVSTLCRKPLN